MLLAQYKSFPLSTDFDADIRNCCNQIKAGLECDFSSLAFQKDVYDPKYYDGPATTETLLSIITFGVLVFALKNLKQIYSVRNEMSVKTSFLMNLLVFLALLSLFVYTLDGPIRLFSDNFGFHPLGIQILQVFTVGFFLYTLAYSSYTWIKLICIHKDTWGDNFITKATRMFIVIDIIFITVVILINLLIVAVKELDFTTTLVISYLFLSIGTLVNGVAFTISCYVLATNLKEIYNFDARKQTKVKVLRALAIVLAFFSFARIVNDLYSFFDPDWQTKLKVESYCQRNIKSSAYIFFYLIFCDILPQLLFLVVFSPSNQEKTQSSSQNEYEWPRYGSDDDSIEPFQP